MHSRPNQELVDDIILVLKEANKLTDSELAICRAVLRNDRLNSQDKLFRLPPNIQSLFSNVTAIFEQIFHSDSPDHVAKIGTDEINQRITSFFETIDHRLLTINLSVVLEMLEDWLRPSENHQLYLYIRALSNVVARNLFKDELEKQLSDTDKNLLKRHAEEKKEIIEQQKESVEQKNKIENKSKENEFIQALQNTDKALVAVEKKERELKKPILKRLQDARELLQKERLFRITQLDLFSMDPTNPESLAILDQFLKDTVRSNGKMTSSGIYPHLFTQSDGKQKLVNLLIDVPIIYFPITHREPEQIKPRFYLVNPHLLGRGVFANVYETIGYFEYNRNKQLVYKIDNKHVIRKEKMEKIPPPPLPKENLADKKAAEDKKEKVLTEAELFDVEFSIARDAKHLRVKEFKSIEEDPDSFLYGYGYMVMQIFKGVSLDKFLQKNNPSLDQRLIICRNILRAIQEQVHNYGIAHRDIKPENILIDDDFNIHIIDFGNSVKNTKAAAGFIGSPSFMAPEAFDRQVVDIKSDIAATGLVLAYVLGAEKRTFDVPPKELIPHYRNHYAGKEIDIPITFPGEPTEKTEEYKKRISAAVNAMVNVDRNKRPEPLTVEVNVFDPIIIERKVEPLSKREQDELKIAYNEANRVRRLIAQKHNPNIDVIENIIETREIIEEALKSLTDRPHLIKEFVDTLGIKILKPAPNTKEKILQLLDTLQANIKQNEKKLINLSHKIENHLPHLLLYILGNFPHQQDIIPKLEELASELDHIGNKSLKGIHSLDDIAALNSKYESALPRLESAYSAIKSDNKEVQTLLSGPYPDILNRMKRLGVANIVPKEAPQAPKNPELEDKKLRREVLKVLLNYIKKTLTPENIKKEDRAASKKRIAEIKDILGILETDAKGVTLQNDLISRIDEMGGNAVKKLFDRSVLHHSLKKALASYRDDLKLHNQLRPR